jgi:hypothetical protein
MLAEGALARPGIGHVAQATGLVVHVQHRLVAEHPFGFHADALWRCAAGRQYAYVRASRSASSVSDHQVNEQWMLMADVSATAPTGAETG